MCSDGGGGQRTVYVYTGIHHIWRSCMCSDGGGGAADGVRVYGYPSYLEVVYV